MDDPVPLKSSKMALRDKDLIVAHGKEIRMTSIADDNWDVVDGQLGRYKVRRVELTLPGSLLISSLW